MVITIELPDLLETRLQQKALGRCVSMEVVVLEILEQALETEKSFPTPENIVARIKATPPNPHNIRPANGSLADALRNAPLDPDFDLSVWNREWTVVEEEMKEISRMNANSEMLQ